MDTEKTLNPTDSSSADAMLSSSTISTNPVDLARREAPTPEVKKEEAAPEPKTEEVKVEDAKPKETTEAVHKEEPKEEDRFDKHPRFQELISEKNALKSQNAQLQKAFEQLANEVNALKARRETPEVPVDQELAELFEVDQGKALARMLEIAEQRAEQKVLSKIQENSAYSTLSGALQTYQAENPDFTTMWEDGTLEKVMRENPLYNTPIAAYQHLASEAKAKAFESTMKAEIEKAVEAARKEEREAADKRVKEVEANFKAKKETTVVTERTSVPSGTKTDSDTGGDRVSWLVRRAREREAAG
jgi:hypothetical protein